MQIVLHIVFLNGLGICTALAPDETTYKSLFEKYLNSKELNISDTIVGSNGYVYNFTFYLSQQLSVLGFQSLTALRISAILFFTVSQVINFYLVNTNQKLQSKKIKALIYFIISFTPSIFIFGGLALRESLLMLSISLIFLAVHYLESNYFFRGALFSSLGFSILSGLKIYLFLVIGLSFLLYALFKRSRSKKIVIVAFLSLGLSFSLNASNIFVLFTSTSINSGEIKKENEILKNIRESDHTNQESSNVESITLTGISKCQADGSIGFLKFFLNRISGGAPSAGAPSAGAPSAGAPSAGAPSAGAPSAGAPSAETAGDLFGGEDVRGILHPKFYFVNFFYFLFNPLTNFDVPVSRYFLIEIPIWVFLYFQTFSLIRRFRKSRLKLDGLATFALFFTLLFIAFSVVSEVNVGTSIRHRVLLLFPLVLLFSRLHPNRNSPLTPGKNHQ
jgi:hypothetical protein